MFCWNALSLFRYNIRLFVCSLRDLALYNFYNTNNATCILYQFLLTLKSSYLSCCSSSFSVPYWQVKIKYLNHNNMFFYSNSSKVQLCTYHHKYLHVSGILFRLLQLLETILQGICRPLRQLSVSKDLSSCALN